MPSFWEGTLLKAGRRERKAASEGPYSLQDSVPSCVRLCENLGFTVLRPIKEMLLRGKSTKSNGHPASCHAGVTRPLGGA